MKLVRAGIGETSQTPHSLCRFCKVSLYKVPPVPLDPKAKRLLITALVAATEPGCGEKYPLEKIIATARNEWMAQLLLKE